MSQQNEAIVRRLFDEVWNKGDVALLTDLLTPDHVQKNSIDPGRGLEDARNNVTKYRTAFPDARLDIEEMFSTEDRVVVRMRYSGTHRGMLESIAPTGRHVSGSGIAIYRMREGKICETCLEWDALAFFQQLGILTLPGRTKAAGA